MPKKRSTPSSAQPFYSLSPGEVIGLLRTDAERGLSASEITERQAVYGRNVIDHARRASFFTLLARQFKNPLIIVLAAAGIVTMVTHEIRDALFIFCAVIVNAALGLYQENKAERALAELKTYLRERCRVIRGGVEQEIDATELVPGDIIRLAQGDRVQRPVVHRCQCRNRFVRTANRGRIFG
jgi:magnesium-transporting ATPase (P-type)